jgi:DnaK suppressor protein
MRRPRKPRALPQRFGIPSPLAKTMRLPVKKPAKQTTSEFKNFTPYKTKKGEEYMNEKQKEHFRGILKNWRSELMEEVDRTVSHMKDEAANFPDPADRATQEEEFSLELRTRDRERKLIKKIESTLELIDQDEYGFCDACGIEIGIKRLEARPTATLCIDCKTLEEIKEKQEHG